MNSTLRRSRLQRWLIAWHTYKTMSGDAAVRFLIEEYYRIYGSKNCNTTHGYNPTTPSSASTVSTSFTRMKYSAGGSGKSDG